MSDPIDSPPEPPAREPNEEGCPEVGPLYLLPHAYPADAPLPPVCQRGEHIRTGPNAQACFAAGVTKGHRWTVWWWVIEERRDD